MSLTITQIHQLLIDIAEQTPREEQIKRYSYLLVEILIKNEGHPIEVLKVFIEVIVQNNVFLEVSQSLLTSICRDNLPFIPQEESKLLAHFILDAIKPRIISFEDIDCSVRQYLASIYDKEKNWMEAASVLVGIRLETGQKKFLDDYKFNIYLQIIRLYMETDEPTMADPFMRMASSLQNKIKNESLLDAFKECNARLLDFKCMFNEAAQKYYDLSNWSSISDEKCIMATKNTLICTVLSSVGEQRRHMLGKLIQEERFQTLPAFLVLKKMYLVQLIRFNEITLLDAMLKPHHRTKTTDGFTMLEQAIIEHNLLAVQKLYKNIKIVELGRLLGIEPIKAERIAAKLMRAGHLECSIDQVDGLIYFKKEHNKLQAWDKNIESICHQVNHIAKLISKDLTTFTDR